ncbi:MAG: DUF1566 domain-containing protein, partial [Gammaproteobacteria bacterium]|nr:DUF1566 domain-containing protein [Gammaproteobacteria bacterium]
MKNNLFIVIVCLSFVLIIQTVYAKQGIRIVGDKKMYEDAKPSVNRERQVAVDCMKLEYIRNKGGLSTEFLDLKWPEKNQHISLRNKPKMVDEKGYQEIIYRYNFNDSYTHSNGCFRNKFESTVHFYSDNKKHKTHAHLDQVTDLMWKMKLGNKKTFQEAMKELDEWNKKNYGGYSDWRIPTLDEAASLYTKYGHTHGGLKQKFWIADTFHDDELHWVGDLLLNSSYLEPLEEKIDDEVKKLKVELLMVRNQPPPYPIKPRDVNLENQLC